MFPNSSSPVELSHCERTNLAQARIGRLLHCWHLSTFLTRGVPGNVANGFDNFKQPNYFNT